MKKKLFVIILTALMLFIWVHSLIPTQESASESAGIKQILQWLLDLMHIPVTLTDVFVRKLAHFTEFAVLGAILGLHLFPLAKAQEERKLKALYYSLPFAAALLIAFIDETLQIFSGRGPMIQDVWLDFAGAVFGAGVVWLILFIKFRKKIPDSE